jgi:hypothetical protein
LVKAGAEAVGAGDDHAIINAEFHERVADSADLREEVLVRHGHLAVLVAALLFVRDLVLDLDAAGARFDELLGEEIGRLGIAETGVDVRDDRHDVRFVLVDLVQQAVRVDRVTRSLRRIELAEQHAQFTRIGLTQEGVELFDQRRNAGLLVHRLVGQRAEFAAQRGNHPARKVEVAALGRAEVLLDGDHLLLADEAVPAGRATACTWPDPRHRRPCRRA